MKGLSIISVKISPQDFFIIGSIMSIYITLIIHWFDNYVSVIGQTYLDMLKEKVWPKIRNLASRRLYLFQQNGAAVHITNGVREWLYKTFHGRVISRMMEHPWTAAQKSGSLSIGLRVLECGDV